MTDRMATLGLLFMSRQEVAWKPVKSPPQYDAAPLIDSMDQPLSLA